MSRARTMLLVTGFVVTVLAWGEVRFNQGFETGADVAQCVFEAMIAHDAHGVSPTCGRVSTRTPSWFIRLVWLRITGNEVKSVCHGDGTCTVGGRP